MARWRERWKAHQHRIAPERLVFLDETWIKTDMTRLRGWFKRGTALVAKVPHGHWKTLTFIAGLRQGEVVAPCVFDGPINANSFSAWVEQSLVPTLKPGDVVVLDNLSSHKDPRASKAIRAAGAHLLVPAALQPRSQPDRDALRQAQDALPKGRSENHRDSLARNRNPARSRHSGRVRRLPPPRRIWCYNSLTHSRCALVRPCRPAARPRVPQDLLAADFRTRALCP